MAGTLTTAWMLEVTMYWLIRQPDTLRKLKEELATAIPDLDMIGTIPLPVLEQLPYLNAVIKEGLRLTYGVSCRLARIDPDNAIICTYKPTPISPMSHNSLLLQDISHMRTHDPIPALLNPLRKPS